jgi:hypothetical protein
VIHPSSATLLLAHTEGGLGDAGLSSALILFVSVSLLVLVAVGLRATWSTARFGSGQTGDDGGSDSPGSNALTIAGRVVTLTLLTLVLLIGFGGSPTSGANPVPPAVYTAFWYGGLLLAVLFGDVWAAVNPAVAIAEVIDRARGRTGDVETRPQPAPSDDGLSSGIPPAVGREGTSTGDGTGAVLLDPTTGRPVDVATLDRTGPGPHGDPPDDHPPADPDRGRAPDGTEPGDVWWLPAVLLTGFVVLWICWPGGVRPRPTATYVAIWAVVMVVGGAVHGPRWVRRHEPFGLLFSAVAGCAPVRWLQGEASLTGPARHLASRLHDPATARVDLATAAVLTVSLGATIFDGVRVTRAWAELIGPRSLTSLGIVNTFALVWIIVTVAAVWMAATRAIDRLAGDDVAGTDDRDHDPIRLTLALAPALAAIVAVSRLASDLDRFLLSGQNLLSLASDPFANGADLLGTVDWMDHPILSPVALAWIGCTLLLAGHLVALVAVHDRTVAWFGLRVAARAVWPLTGFLVLSLAVALQLLGI